MQSKLLTLIVLAATLAACSHGYTPEGDARTGTEYHSYDGGITVPAVMPEDRAHAHGD